MSRNAFASADSVAIKTADPFPELVPIWWRGSLGAFDPRLQKALAPLAHCRLVKTQARCDRAVGHPLIRRQDDLRTHLGIEPNEGGIPGNLHLCIEESEWSQWLYEILSPYVAELVVYRGEWKPGMKRDAIDAHASVIT